jgi:hypothetical protein
MNAKELWDKINEADTIYIHGDGGAVATVWGIAEPVGDPDNEVLHFAWEDEIGQEFRCILSEQSLTEAVVRSNRVTAVDADDEEIVFDLYRSVPHNIEPCY